MTSILLKKCGIILLVSMLFLSTTVAWAQNNTFPTNGNVGIGTSSPTSKLQVNGGVSITGTNPIQGVNNFRNAIQLINPRHAAMIFNPGEETQLMMGFHVDNKTSHRMRRSYIHMGKSMG